MNFSGWVPTVTGHLSFSILGMGSFPNKCIRSEFVDGFAVLQKRDLLDVLIPYADDSSVLSFFREKMSNWMLRISGQFTFLMVANWPEEGKDCCSGRILMIANSQAKSAVKGIKNRLRTVERDKLTKDELEKIAEHDCCYCAEFTLERKGKLTISVEPQESETSTIDTLLANQAFYFVKDVAHVHQHHDPKHDAITEMTLIESDNEAWMQHTSYSLYRAIIRYKRFRSEKALFRASGVLAYTKAFQTNYPTKEGAKKFAHEELEQSLEVSRAELQHFDQKRIASIETFRNFFFALFGLAISVSYLSRLANPADVVVDPRVVQFAALLAQYPLHAVGSTVLASAFWMIITHQIEPADNEIVTWVARLFQNFRRRYFIVFNIILTAALCTVCYWLLIGFS